MSDQLDRRAAQILAHRGFDPGAALYHAKRANEPVFEPKPVLTQEEIIAQRHEERYGYAPMQGLSDVDYSDIFTEFDTLNASSTSRVFDGYAETHLPSDSFSVLQIRERNGALLAQARRAEVRIYDYKIATHRKTMPRYGEGLVRRGFVDAIHSVCKDVDLMDPRVEVDMFLKYMLIRANFIGGACPRCKHADNWVVGVREVSGFAYTYKCKHCRRSYGPKAGTLFKGSHLPLTTLMDVIRQSLDLNNYSSVRIGKNLGVTQKTTWQLRTLVRNNSLLNDGRWFGERGATEEDRKAKHTATTTFRSLEQLEQLIP